MLRLEHISVAYGKHEALHDVTVDIAPSRTTAILGANGAGKSTLLKTVAVLSGRSQVAGFCSTTGRSNGRRPTASSQPALLWCRRAAVFSGKCR